MKLLFLICSLLFWSANFALSLSDYDECNQDGEAPVAYCSYFRLLLNNGGGFDVWNHMPDFPEYKDTIRPYKKEYLAAMLATPFGVTIVDDLYRDLEKIWGCLAKDDLECLASMTYIVQYDQFTSNPLSLDNVKKGKWRIKAQSKRDTGYFCKEMGEYFPGVKAGYKEPNSFEDAYKIAPYVAFSDPLQFYKCIFNDKSVPEYVGSRGYSDSSQPQDKPKLWFGRGRMYSYYSIKNMLRTTFIGLSRGSSIDRNKGLNENFPTPFFVNLAHGLRYEDSIILLYGTPVNPKGFAIAGFGRLALECENFCYGDFKDGP